MKHPELEASAVQYLRYELRCLLVMTERAPCPYFCRPDVIGITADRQIVEVEIKRTIQDFRNNGKKYGMQFSTPAWKRYFLVPEIIREKVVAEAGDGWGVMVPGKASTISGIPEIQVVKSATVNKIARRLDMQDFMRCVREQTGTLFSVMAANVKLKQRLEELTL